MSLRLLQGGAPDPDPCQVEEYRVSADGTLAVAKDGHTLRLLDLGIYQAEAGSRLWVLR